MMMKQFVLFFGGWMLVNAAVGQIDFAYAVAEYPDDRALLTQRVHKVFYDIVDDELQVSEEVVVEYMMLRSGNVGYASDDVSYNSFSRIEDLEAYASIPNEKGNYKTTKVKTFTERDEFTEGIFHDDSRSIQFRYPSIEPGTKIGYSYRRVHLMPQVTSSFFFINQTPSLGYRFELHVANGVEERLAFFNIDTTALLIERTREPRKRVIRIEQGPSLGVRIFPGATPLGDWAPHIIVHPQSYTVGGKTTRVLKTYHDLAEWYEHKLQIIDPYEEELVKSEVEKVIAGANSTEEKLKRIYRFTQDQIKYVAFEDGLGGFVPRNANAVLAKRFGDCKDMSYLMYEMCTAAGIPAYLTWVGTRDIPYSYHEMPTPIVDNHMILTAGDPDKPGAFYWLDATASTWEFGVPTSFIQGKEAMVRFGADDYRIIDVPVVDAAYNLTHEQVRLEVNGKNALKGTGLIQIGGDHRATFTERFAHTKKDGKEDKEVLRNFLEKGNNTFDLKSYSVDYPEEYSGEVGIEHSFELNNYLVNVGDEIIVNLNVNKVWEDFTMEDDREQPYAFTMTSQYSYVTEFEIPSGYTLEALPTNRSFEGDGFGFNFAYEVGEGQVTYQQTIRLNRLTLDQEDFGSWNAMIKELNRAYRDALVLKAL